MVAALTVSLVAAACSPSPEATSAAESDVVDASATETTMMSDEPISTDDSADDGADEQSFPDDPAPEIPSELSFADPSAQADAQAEPTTGADDPVASGSRPIASQNKGPQTETPAGPSGDPFAAGYKGPVGGWGLTEVLSETIVPLPSVTPGTAPLTGLAGSIPHRPAVVVKIDNSSKARPQAGVALADIVIEQEVEGGVTRLAAIFHTNDATVGPIRSARSTDVSFISALGDPAFVYSGANQITDDVILSSSEVQNFSASRNGGFWRESSRRAPSNVFADVNSFNNTGSSPPAWFHYRASGVASPGTPTTSVNVRFGGSRAAWSWDGATWLRSQNGSAHVADTGQRVTAANVIVAEVPSFDTGLRDSGGGVIPEFVWAGAGAVTVFTDGKRIDGQWVRPRLVDPAVLQAADGSIIELTPGVTWVELVEPNRLSSS